MECGLPTNMNDPRMEYALELAYRIDVEIDENDCGFLGTWINIFLSRLRQNVIDPPFTWEAFCDNTDIIGTIKGYGMDVEKFWFVLLFIYDMTIDHTTNVADRSKNYYELLIETRDYIDEHPNAYIYISDDRELRKKNRLEISTPWMLYTIRKRLDEEIKRIEKDEFLKLGVFPYMEKGYDIQLPPTLQMYYMTQKFKTLFEVLNLPEKRARYTRYTRDATDPVSYNKLLLISRLLYFCKFTKNTAFVVDDSSIKGIIQQYKGYRRCYTSKIYV